LGDIAVKEVDEEPATEALEGVSRGVKQAGARRPQPGVRKGRFGKARPALVAEQEEIEEEITLYSSEEPGEERSTTANVRRRGSSAAHEKKKRFGGSQEQARKAAQLSRVQREGAGISNRNLAKETSRQKKAASARREAKPTGRRRAS